MGSLKKQLQAMERDALRAAVLRDVERVATLLDLEPLGLKQEALRLMDHAHLAPELTPERLAQERGVMYAAARRRCDRIGLDFEQVRSEVDALVESLVEVTEAQRLSA